MNAAEIFTQMVNSVDVDNIEYVAIMNGDEILLKVVPPVTPEVFEKYLKDMTELKIKFLTFGVPPELGYIIKEK